MLAILPRAPPFAEDSRRRGDSAIGDALGALGLVESLTWNAATRADLGKPHLAAIATTPAAYAKRDRRGNHPPERRVTTL